MANDTRGAAAKQPLSPHQRKIEVMYQRAMNLRDSSPGWVPDRLENSYAKAYILCFRRNNAASVSRFRVATRNYRQVLRRTAHGRVLIKKGDRND